MRRTWPLAAGVWIASGLAAFAQSDRTVEPSYAGAWKLNVAKSDFGESTLTYEEPSPSRLRLTVLGQSYEFGVDGKEYPSPFGGTAAWRQINATTWETAIRQKGEVLNTTTTRLSEDGQTLTTNEKGPKPTGGTFERTTVYTRASGGPGLLGIWKTKNPPRMPRVVELVPSGTDGLSIRFPDDRESCEAKFDGKDYPMAGPIAQPGLTLSVQKTGRESFDVTGKQDGKPLFKFSFSVAEDGRTLTQAGGMVGVSQRVEAVYDRQ